MNTYFKIDGHDAIRLAERDCLQLHCYANPVDDGGPVSVGVAKQIAKEDPSLVFVKVEPDCWWDKQRVSEMSGFNVSDFFAADATMKTLRSNPVN